MRTNIYCSQRTIFYFYESYNLNALFERKLLLPQCKYIKNPFIYSKYIISIRGRRIYFCGNNYLLSVTLIQHNGRLIHNGFHIRQIFKQNNCYRYHLKFNIYYSQLEWLIYISDSSIKTQCDSSICEKWSVLAAWV